MRDYGKVFSRIWESEDFRSMNEDGRALVMYLLTCQHGTIAGVFRVPDGYACEDLQWSAERVASAFAETLRQGFANRCETTKWVWVVKFLQWNPPENPNQRKAAAKVALAVPDGCVWKRDFMRVGAEVLALELPGNANPSVTVPEPLLNQKQKQKQEQKEEASPEAPPDPRGSRLPVDWSLPAEWAEWAQAERPDLDAAKVAESFRDFWVGKPGKDGRKSDWQATWRNWVRSTKAAPRAGLQSSPTLAGAI